VAVVGRQGLKQLTRDLCTDLRPLLRRHGLELSHDPLRDVQRDAVGHLSRMQPLPLGSEASVQRLELALQALGE
jgi:hypothetical protein